MQARDIGDETRIRELKKLRAGLGPPVLAALRGPRTIGVVLNPDGRLRQENLDGLMQGTSRIEPWQAAAILKVVVTREKPIVPGGLPGVRASPTSLRRL
jgi:hypothetical protein